MESEGSDPMGPMDAGHVRGAPGPPSGARDSLGGPRGIASPAVRGGDVDGIDVTNGIGCIDAGLSDFMACRECSDPREIATDDGGHLVADTPGCIQELRDDPPVPHHSPTHQAGPTRVRPPSAGVPW